jgi:uncharacterized protein YkvS
LANATSNIQDQITARVSKTGAVEESIDGLKTFSNNLKLGASSNLVLTSPSTTLSQTVLSYLANATSNIQDQITARVSKTGAVAESIDGVKTFSNLKLNGDLTLTTPSVALTQTELSRLSGVTSNIQTQINNMPIVTSSSSDVTLVLNASDSKTIITNSGANYGLFIGYGRISSTPGQTAIGKLSIPDGLRSPIINFGFLQNDSTYVYNSLPVIFTFSNKSSITINSSIDSGSTNATLFITYTITYIM